IRLAGSSPNQRCDARRLALALDCSWDSPPQTAWLQTEVTTEAGRERIHRGMPLPRAERNWLSGAEHHWRPPLPMGKSSIRSLPPPSDELQGCPPPRSLALQIVDGVSSAPQPISLYAHCSRVHASRDKFQALSAWVRSSVEPSYSVPAYQIFPKSPCRPAPLANQASPRRSFQLDNSDAVHPLLLKRGAHRQALL